MARLFVRVGEFFVAEITGEMNEVVTIAETTNVSDVIRSWGKQDDEVEVVASELSPGLRDQIEKDLTKRILHDIQRR